ncbi:MULTISPECIES: DUF1697 domain-containing protein [Microbacterium]|uniref:DUF1697 domain-containing protein n=1 Tax=Microbacterium TaxID=33882 RepID=UPI000D65C6E7|nr:MULTISPECIES: DUF1697 domain-containing protein [Microbacterium]
MHCVAFMRNVNQGQRGHPSTADILAGFADAGCPDARTFQSNGTVVFDSDRPAEVVATAEEAIAARSGHAREILWTSMHSATEVVHKHGATPEPRRFEFTLHRGAAIDAHDADATAVAAEHRCAIVDAGRGWALVRNDVPGEGHATPVLERLTGERATSRGLPTLIRLVTRFGA